MHIFILIKAITCNLFFSHHRQELIIWSLVGYLLISLSRLYDSQKTNYYICTCTLNILPFCFTWKIKVSIKIVSQKKAEHNYDRIVIPKKWWKLNTKNIFLLKKLHSFLRKCLRFCFCLLEWFSVSTTLFTILSHLSPITYLSSDALNHCFHNK